METLLKFDPFVLDPIPVSHYNTGPEPSWKRKKCKSCRSCGCFCNGILSKPKHSACREYEKFTGK